MLNSISEAFKQPEDLLQSNCSQSCNLSNEQKKKMKFLVSFWLYWCIGEKTSRNTANQHTRLYHWVVCCCVSIPKQIIQFLVLLTGLGRIISTAASPSGTSWQGDTVGKGAAPSKAHRFPWSSAWAILSCLQASAQRVGRRPEHVTSLPVSDIKEQEGW